MQRERDELVDHSYRRDFLTYDNHMLDGEMFLQVINTFTFMRLFADLSIKYKKMCPDS